MLRMRLLLWLLPVLGSVLVVAVYRDAYATEAGSRAGAEPVLAGLWVAGPLILLALVQVMCALGVDASTTVRGRLVCLVVTLTAAGACLIGASILLSA